MRFQAVLQQSGRTATGIRVPDEIVTGLGSSRRPAVTVMFKGHSYRTSIASMGGVFMLPVSAAQRAAAGVRAGDMLDIEVVLDHEPREVSVPADFLLALDSDREAKTLFERLAYSHKLRHVLAIEGAKTTETRQRRIAKAIDMLRAGKQRRP